VRGGKKGVGLRAEPYLAHTLSRRKDAGVGTDEREMGFDLSFAGVLVNVMVPVASWE
jgi:hypothetical protein